MSKTNLDLIDALELAKDILLNQYGYNGLVLDKIDEQLEIARAVESIKKEAFKAGFGKTAKERLSEAGFLVHRLLDWVEEKDPEGYSKSDLVAQADDFLKELEAENLY